MEHRNLGTAGPAVSRLALGAMTFGDTTDEPTSRAMLDTFVERGGTLIDTADTYNGGESERIVGRWLTGRRDSVVLATKGRFPVAGGSGGVSPEYLRGALEASLQRLGVDHIDLYQVHGPDAAYPIEGIIGFFDEAVRAGKIRYAGVSNLPGWQRAKLARLATDVAPIVSNQPQYNLLAREVEWEVLPAAIDAGMGTLPWGPLAAGWLTGKFHRDQAPASGTRVGDAPDHVLETWERRGTDATWRILDVLRSVASRHGVTPAQAALAWVADRPGVTAPIVGARTEAQLKETLDAADLHLAAEATRQLDEASAPATPPYPYWLLDQLTAR
ncbi:MAG TPA: aldo/keto reductase [Mycobacteriales bacterium]|nr:aldo/keto reductase [Mycobacteriales bacterium]